MSFVIFVGISFLRRSFNHLQPQFLHLYIELLTFPSCYKIMWLHDLNNMNLWYKIISWSYVNFYSDGVNIYIYSLFVKLLNKLKFSDQMWCLSSRFQSIKYRIRSDQISCSVMSDSLRPHESYLSIFLLWKHLLKETLIAGMSRGALQRKQ